MSWVLLVLCGAAPLTFEEAIARVDEAPDVRGAFDAAQARAKPLGQLPALTSNPVITAQPGLRGTSAGLGLEAQLSVQQAFNLASLSKRRLEVGTSDALLLRHQAVSTRWQRRVAAGQAWLDAWAAKSSWLAATREVEAAERLVARLERAAATHDATQVELASARAFAAEAHAFAVQQEGLVFEAEAALASLLGEEAIAHIASELPELATRRLEAGSAPEERTLQAGIELAAAREREARAVWGTTLTTTAWGLREATGFWGAGVGVGLTLPVFEQGQAEAAAAHAQRTRLEGELLQARQRTLVTVQLLEHELTHSAEVLAIVDGAQRVAAEEAARLETVRFEHGETSLLELVLVRRQALAAQVAAFTARANVQLARFKAAEWLAVVEDAP